MSDILEMLTRVMVELIAAIMALTGSLAAVAEVPQDSPTVAVSHPADDCFEDQDWVTVDWRTPGAYDMNNGTRLCVNRDGGS